MKEEKEKKASAKQGKESGKKRKKEKKSIPYPRKKWKKYSPENEEIMVSVVVLTYNQERYISQALDSILWQKVNFPIEILVGEDCSTDGTPRIVQKYQKKYPKVFRVFCRKENLGPTRNAYELYIRTRGKYFVSLEGDDYFSDPNKLQMQTDFLESHSEYYACATRFRYIDQDGNPIDEMDIPDWERRFWYGNKKNVYTWKDFEEGRSPSQAATMLTRNYFKTDDASIIYKAHPFLGDITGLMIQISHGDIYIMQDIVTVAYRRNLNAQGPSWNMKVQSTPFHQYHMIQYFQSLRSYAATHLPIKFQRERDVLNSFFRMADNCVHYPTAARWRCLGKMILMTNRKIHYTWVTMKAIYLSLTYPVVRNTPPLPKEDPMYRRFSKSWGEFKKVSPGRKLVLYGAGGGGADFLESYYDRVNIDCVVDGNVNRQGSYFYGFLIYPPEKIQEMDTEKTVIIITSGYYYRDIADSLESIGIHHYFVYPLMEQKRWKYKPLKWLSDYISIVRD